MSELLPTVEIEPAVPATATVIWLHGLGADGHDFEPVVPELGLPRGHAIRFVFPHAPRRPVTVNGGYVMRAWYDILGADLVRREDEAGLRQSQQQVAALIDRERERGVPAHRIVLGGFSQGCAMSLLTGLRYPERLAGIAGLSGYLPLADTLAAEAHDANRLVPIFLGHGLHDGVVTLARATSTRQALQEAGYDVAWHTYPMQHSVCAEEVRDLNDWLLKVLAR